MDQNNPKTDGVAESVLISSPKVLKREVYEAAREARDVVALAQEKANRILEDARHERDSICEQARQEGVAKGLAEWNQILARTAQRAEESARNWEDTMLRLSVRVAEKIIGRELTLDPNTIVDIVRESLRGIRPGKHLVIQVNEADAPPVRAQVSRLKDGLGLHTEIEIVPSSAVAPGGCVIESELGIVDARLETQLKCLEDALVRGSSAD